jgi:hypothetical protein
MSNKIGVNLNIDVSKLDKNRFVSGKNGAIYCDLTIFIDPDNPSEWGTHGILTQSKKKDEARDLKLPIVGNGKVFWQDQSEPQPVPNASYDNTQAGAPAPDLSTDGIDDEIPF